MLTNLVLFYAFSFLILILSVTKPPHQSYTKKINEALDLLKKLVTATPHSEGPASQGEAAPPHLISLMKKYEELQPIGSDLDTGGKKKSVSVQNRNIAHGIIGVQASLVNPEEGIRFSTQAANRSNGKEVVDRSADNSAVIVISSDSDTSPSVTNKTTSKRSSNSNIKDGKDAQKVLAEHSVKTEQTSRALRALTDKLSEGSSSHDLQFKRDQLKLNQDYLINEQETKKAKIELAERKFDSEKKMREDLMELKRDKINAEVSKSKVSIHLLKIKQLNEDKDKAYERLARYDNNPVICTRIIKEIESLDVKIKAFYNAW